MTGWQLKLWRRSLLWKRERAAAELGVSLRTYKDYENADTVKRSIALATVTLSLINMLPSMQRHEISSESMVRLINQMISTVDEK
ncbi:XRE family transcriptional regulator [Pantoea agglomerans]|uniref:XRE family transcriptional regulator n=1 Tax=Enterobacter agglomerans TaxID=549 RepID=UPI00177C379C|nr:XRE family transcriptional regulator [Pantoea agglomerans]MBD8145831.1 XRE family transcriptional regulator [Pantoea agglomerans]WVL82671.1 XRE family transcriptional regulator [Pantoea agglomerans]WVL87883.1 XRE family transcriptional regulator [Pantoea agglomerans]